MTELDIAKQRIDRIESALAATIRAIEQEKNDVLKLSPIHNEILDYVAQQLERVEAFWLRLEGIDD